MATTTNYGWTTPDDTALVKDGAAAIRTLGTSVDTTTKNLNPSTTLGDIEYRSSTSNTNTRLGIGSTGQVLTVAGGVPTWAAGGAAANLTQVATGSLSGAAVTVTGLSSYSEMYLTITATSAQNWGITLQLNGNTGSNYRRMEFYNGSGGGAINSTVTTSMSLSGNWYASGNNTINASCQLSNTKTTGYTSLISQAAYTSLAGGGLAIAESFTVYEVSEAVSSLTINCDNGTFTGGTYRIWAI